MMFLLWILSPVLLLFILWLYNYLHYYKYLRHMSGPFPLPFIGNALEFKKGSTDVLQTFERLSKKYNTKMIRLNVGPRFVIGITDYDFVEFLLSSNVIISKSHTYRFVQPWLGTGLLTSTGDKWKSHRKMITPTFHFQILEQFLDVFHSCSELLIEKLKPEVGKGSTDIYKFITLCTLDIICETAMGTSVNAQNEGDSIYVKSVKDMLRIVQERTFSPYFHWDFIFSFTKNYRIQTEALKVLHGYTDSVIKKRKAELVGQQANTSDVSNDLGIKKRQAFLDLLLVSTINGESLTDNEIREEVDTFMFEGHDTTASAISFALFCLASDAEVQQKAWMEIKGIFEDDKFRQANYQDLSEMKYLEMVIKESLRLYPSVPFYVRLLTEDVVYNGKVLPKGLALNVNAYGIHRDPDNFPDPEKFDPERFSAENQISKRPFSFLPFSAGPRNCIGQKFAMLEMKALIGKVLRYYELKPVVPAHKMQLAAESVLKSENGILLKVTERDWST